MVDLPLVSIITSCLNDGNALKATIQSIRSSSYPLLEYIVIDGGSVDKTWDIVREAGSLISSVISEPDDGIYDAWNKGLRLATGQYIAFLGAGDIYLVGGLEKLVGCAMENHQADFISSKVQIVRDGLVLRTMGSAWDWKIFRRYMNTVHAGSLHSRRLFDLYGEFDTSYRIAGDYELLLRARDTLKAAYIDSITVRMVAGGASYAGYRVFLETERAKLKNQSVSPWLARIDRYMAQSKRFLRNHFLD